MITDDGNKAAIAPLYSFGRMIKLIYRHISECISQL